MAKFKIGDKVVIKDIDQYSVDRGLVVGDVLVVNEDGENPWCVSDTKKNTRTFDGKFAMYDRELELYEEPKNPVIDYKVGDTVKVVDNSGDIGSKVGDVCVVIAIHEDNTYQGYPAVDVKRAHDSKFISMYGMRYAKIEPTKRIPKVGDRVKSIATRNGSFGNIGIVTGPKDSQAMRTDGGFSIWNDNRMGGWIFLDEVEEPKIAPKRVPKVGDYIKCTTSNFAGKLNEIYKVIGFQDDETRMLLNPNTSRGPQVDNSMKSREFRDGEIPERFREVKPEIARAIADADEWRNRVIKKMSYNMSLEFDRAFYGQQAPEATLRDMFAGKHRGRHIGEYMGYQIYEEPTKPLSTIKKIMGKLEQFRSNLYFSDKKMEKIGELADKLEGYANDINDLVYNLEIVSDKLESYAADIEKAVDEDDRVAATQLIDEATEYLSKVSTLDALSSMLSNAKALDKFTDKQ